MMKITNLKMMTLANSVEKMMRTMIEKKNYFDLEKFLEKNIFKINKFSKKFQLG